MRALLSAASAATDTADADAEHGVDEEQEDDTDADTDADSDDDDDAEEEVNPEASTAPMLSGEDAELEALLRDFGGGGGDTATATRASKKQKQTVKKKETTETWAVMARLPDPDATHRREVTSPAYTWPFELDAFQKEAIVHLERGERYARRRRLPAVHVHMYTPWTSSTPRSVICHLSSVICHLKLTLCRRAHQCVCRGAHERG